LSQSVGNDNTAIGEYAGGAITTGTDNTCLGKNAGGPTTGSHNTVIGAEAQIGTTDSNKVMIYNGTVNANFSGSASSWTFSSDGRDKTDIEDLTFGLNFIKKLQPRKFRWDYRDKKRFPVDSDKNPDMLIKSGFIAQEIQQVLKEENAEFTSVVNETDPDHLTVGQTDLIPMLVNAIKELSAENNALKARLDAAGL